MVDLTPADLDALAELAEKATPGPWEYSNALHALSQIVDLSSGQLIDDMDLVVALRNAAPALIREARRAAVYREALDRIAGGNLYPIVQAANALTRAEEL